MVAKRCLEISKGKRSGALELRKTDNGAAERLSSDLG